LGSIPILDPVGRKKLTRSRDNQQGYRAFLPQMAQINADIEP
jgi:hypothetical protein